MKALAPYRETHYLLDTSDVTDDGAFDQCRQVQDAMVPWKGRWFFGGPGNHDAGWAGLEWAEECARRFDEMLSVPFNQGGTFYGKQRPVCNMIQSGADKVMLIALNSTLETESPWDFACGEIGRPQLKALSQVLKEAPKDVIKIVMMHHHPWLHWNPFMRLRDATSLLMRLRGRIDVLLFGHRHKEGIWRSKWNIPLTIAAPAAYEAPWFREIVVDKGRVTTNVSQWR